jgi:hypothetical protein
MPTSGLRGYVTADDAIVERILSPNIVWCMSVFDAAPGIVASEEIMADASNLRSATISRRKLLIGGIVAGAAPSLLATKASALTKVPATAVHFTTVASNDRNCGACKHFMAPSSCRFVDATVSAGCSCWIWTSKAA